MPDYSTILYEVRDGVAHLTLNRPAAANSANHTLELEMLDAVIRSEDDPAVRALVISGGTGRFFCSGADLKGFFTMIDEPEGLKNRISFMHVALLRIVRAPLPVIAAVNGTAGGGGMGLACACDLVIAAESAKFVMAYTRRGLSPDATTTYFLPRRIGIGRSLELAYTNRTLSAREALEWGIVNRVVPDAALADEAHALAAELAAGRTEAFAAAKRLMHSGWNATLETQIDLEYRTIYGLAVSEDVREAIKAFVEKREPKTKGR